MADDPSNETVAATAKGPPRPPSLDETQMAPEVDEAASVADACVDAEGIEHTQLAPGHVPPPGSVGGARQSLISDDELPSRIGRFVVLRRLGAGGMGVVFACYDETLDRKVAVKLLRPEPGEGGESESGSTGQARLLREAQALARLSHPNIVAVYEVGTWEGQVFVAMEFVDGEPLSAWQQGADRELDAVLRVYRDAGRGLAAAHAAGLIHRDFKPDNVLVGKDGTVRVLDFGLARAASEEAERTVDLDDVRVSGSLNTSLTQTGAIMGTPAYMAPEQFEGKLTDARTDQFAFCVALYEGLYGERPFTGKTFASLATAVSTGQVREEPPYSQVPSDLRRTLLRGLSVDRNDRFPDMDALLVELVRDPGRRRGRLVAAALAGAVLVGVAVAGAAWWGMAGQAAAASRARVDRAFEDAEGPRAVVVKPLAVDGAALEVQRDELALAEAVAMIDDDPTWALAALAELRVPSVMETAQARWAAVAALSRGVAERSLELGSPEWVRVSDDGRAWAALDAAGLHVDGELVALHGAVDGQLGVDAFAVLGTWVEGRLLVVDQKGDLHAVSTAGKATRLESETRCRGPGLGRDGLLVCGGRLLDLRRTVGAGGAFEPAAGTFQPPEAISGWSAAARVDDGSAVAIDTEGALWRLELDAAPVRFEGDASGLRHLTVHDGIVHAFAGTDGEAERTVAAWSLDKRGLAEPRVPDDTALGAQDATDGAWLTVGSAAAPGEPADARLREVTGVTGPQVLRQQGTVLELGWANGTAWTLSEGGYLRFWSARPRYPRRIAAGAGSKARVDTRGRAIALGGADGRVRAWSTDKDGTHEEVLDVKPFGDGIEFLAIDPSARAVAAGTSAGVRVFSLDDGTQQFASSLDRGERVQRVAWSSGKRLALGTCIAGASCGVRVVGPEGTETRQLDARGRLGGRLLELRFSGDGTHLLAADADGAVVAWSLEDGRMTASGALEAGVDGRSAAMLFDDAGNVRAVQWSADGIEVWQIGARGGLQPVAARAGLTGLLVSPRQGAALLRDGEGRVWAWDLVTDRVVRWGEFGDDGMPDALVLCEDRGRWVLGWNAPAGGDARSEVADLDAGARVELPFALGEATACGVVPVTVRDDVLWRLTLPPADGASFTAWVRSQLELGPGRRG